MVKTDVPVTEEITKITGIHPAAIEKFGYDQKSAFDGLQRMAEDCDAFVGHNVLRFDSIMYKAWVGRMNETAVDKLWIDTMIDIKNHEGKRLSYLAADHGILNLFPHSALADAQTVLTIVAKHEINDIVARAKMPTVYIQARHKRSENELVKKQKFRWNPEHKIWWKAVKESDVTELEKSCSFPIGFAAKEITLDLASN